MMATDHDHNGLIEYPIPGNFGERPTGDRRPSNWWDTINFGHEDAYANALAYRACRMLAAVAANLDNKPDADFFRKRPATSAPLTCPLSSTPDRRLGRVEERRRQAP